mgnify:CR=1 FL=1
MYLNLLAKLLMKFSSSSVNKCLLSNKVLRFSLKIMSFIETNEQYILIMELLGESLDQKLEMNGGKFDIGTVLKLGIEIIKLLNEYDEIENNGWDLDLGQRSIKIILEYILTNIDPQKRG